MVVTSEDLLRVTRSGLERPEGLYLPSLIVSLIENDCIELSNSEKISVTFFRSDWSHLTDEKASKKFHTFFLKLLQHFLV